MKHQTLYLLLFFFSQNVMGSSQDINLAIGESITLPTSRLESIRIQKKGLLSLRDNEKTVTFVGKKLGETKVTVGKKEYLIRVLPIESYRTLKSLEDWLNEKRGPQIKVNHKNIMLNGRLLRLDDFLDLKNHTNEKSNFQIQLTMTKNLEDSVRSHLNQVLSSHNLSLGQIRFQPNLQLLLDKSQKKNKSLYQKALRPYGVTVLIDTNSLTHKPMVKIKVYIAHVKKSFIRQWGMEWPTYFSAQVIPNSKTILDSLTLSLNALEAQGVGQLLATPTLLTESGEKAEFHSGGEFPVTTTTQFNNTVQWKRYGLFLNTTPHTNSQGHMQIDIDLQISTLDHNNGANGVPALIRNDVKTQVNMKEPAPILLSGFLRQQLNDANQGLPWLAQIPVFKPLFSVNQTLNSESELVFILVPSFYE